MSEEPELEDQNEKSNTEDKNEEDKSIILQLGDVIRLDAPTNDNLNNLTFIIDYIDPSVVRLVDIKDYVSINLKMHEDGVLGDGSIEGITLIYRNDKLGYARQHDLLVGTWVNLYFGGEIPAIITGEITNLEEDMIEIKTYPDNDTIYINFGYKGLPLDIPIETIEIRERPEIVKSKDQEERMEEGEEEREEREVKEIVEEEDEIIIPVIDVK